MTPKSTPYAIFESAFRVRPDDIDLNRHVHNSRYFDYVLAARYDQMERCYGVAMEEFEQHGFSWVQRAGTIQYKSPLYLGDNFVVKTWIKQILSRGVDVGFRIERSVDGKTCCEGVFNYIMIRTNTGKPEIIPSWILEKYSV